MDRGDKRKKKREDTGSRHSLSLSFSSSSYSSSSSSSSDKSLTTSDQVSEEPIAAAIDNMEEVSKVFNKYDANGDGKISSDELRSSLRALGYNLSDEELRNAMAEMDTDGDGFVDLAEFAEFHRGPQAAAPGAGPDCELRRAFAVYDKDRNGVISPRELHAVMKQLGEKVSVKDCSRMIKTVDLDGDGCVNFKEFAMMMSSNSNSNPASAKKTAGANLQ